MVRGVRESDGEGVGVGELDTCTRGMRGGGDIPTGR